MQFYYSQVYGWWFYILSNDNVLKTGMDIQKRGCVKFFDIKMPK